MKQLLDTSDKFVIVGLGDRVFVGCLDQNEQQEKRDGMLVVVELDLRHDVESGLAAPTSISSPSAAAAAAAADTKPTIHPLEVQAVSICKHQSKNRLHCGVSCYNKSLLIYDLDLSALVVDSPQQEQCQPALQKPVTVHKTFKRAGCLCFASIIAQDDTNGSSSDGSSDATSLTVLIAGDLSGDAVAFPLTVVASAPVTDLDPTRAKGEDGVNEADESEDTSKKNQKLLLGHTASMLTGVKVVSDGLTSRILTSDRDEKVRVSSFPDSFLIQGYLLGHEAFVSSMDVASVDGVTRCVTCSGDGTVRLWDYETCKELSTLSVSEDGLVVPSRVAINPSGTRVAVIFDEISRLDILDASTGSLQTLCSLNCSSPTLSIRMLDDETLLVLVTKPPFLHGFRLMKDQERPTECEFSFVTALGVILGPSSPDGRGSTIISTSLPTSVLEKDRFGEPMMKKNREKRGPAFDMPWNNAERKEIAKEREKRYKKQKRRNQKSGVGSADHDGTGE